MKEINAMGKVCPLPVIETKKALKSEEGKDGVSVLVDNLIATQNLSKMADQMKLSHSVEQISASEYRVQIGGVGEEPVKTVSQTAPGNGYVVAVGSDEMGIGDSVLGKKLIGSFLYALAEQDEMPRMILFYNAGVRLTVEGSASLEDLRALQSAGVEILSCGLCLDFYGVKETLAVGSVTNMYRIVEIMCTHHTVTP